MGWQRDGFDTDPAGAAGGGGTDASALTTGTLAAARLPGVLANVDTQAELLSAAAAAAASHTHAASDIASGTVATARLGSGTADSTTFLRGDQTWAAPSGGFTPRYARFSRHTSDQTGISGSYAVDYFQYNNEDTDADSIASVSGDDITLSAAGTYLVTQHLYQLSGAYCSLDVNGVAEDRPLQFWGDYARLVWIVRTTGANQILKFAVTSSSAVTLKYTDTVRDNRVNFVEILRIA